MVKNQDSVTRTVPSDSDLLLGLLLRVVVPSILVLATMAITIAFLPVWGGVLYTAGIVITIGTVAYRTIVLNNPPGFMRRWW